MSKHTDSSGKVMTHFVFVAMGEFDGKILKNSFASSFLWCILLVSPSRHQRENTMQDQAKSKSLTGTQVVICTFDKPSRSFLNSVMSTAQYNLTMEAISALPTVEPVQGHSGAWTIKITFPECDKPFWLGYVNGCKGLGILMGIEMEKNGDV